MAFVLYNLISHKGMVLKIMSGLINCPNHITLTTYMNSSPESAMSLDASDYKYMCTLCRDINFNVHILKYNVQNITITI